MVAVASFYRFVDLDDPPTLADQLRKECGRHTLKGTVLIAEEGINASLTGDQGAILAVVDWLQRRLELDPPFSLRWSAARSAPFRRLRVRVKSEIVTLGRPDLRPQQRTGRHVSPDEWNRLLADPDTLVIDTRNAYEVEVGSFPGAVNPSTASFREFPEFVDALPATERSRPVAMFCTGGIRCEKAAALMLEAGFESVSQLEGGILNYLEQVDPGDDRWEGECFVFDTRVAIDRDLAEGAYEQCHACRRPLGPDDLASPDYREGVSCPRCIESADDRRRAGLEERRRQVRLAAERGTSHLGPRAGSDR